MTPSPWLATSEDLALAHPGVRVRTIVAIRWIAIAGQIVTLAFVRYVLAFPLAILPGLLAVLASVALNAALLLVYKRTAHLSGRQASLQLAFDLVQLSVLLYLTGGLANPFALLILVPVTISATLLSGRSTYGLLVLAAVCLTVLALWALPLPWRADEAPRLPDTYRFGVWVALVVGMLFLAAYAWRVSAEARRRQRALVATQAALARSQQLSAVGGLAAAAAHELGSPLGTILLVASDLVSQLGNDPDFGTDVHLLKEQARACGDILKRISVQGPGEAHFSEASLAAILHETAHRHERSGIRHVFEVSAEDQRWRLSRSPELLNALDNFVANAVRHARQTVAVGVTSDRDRVNVRIEDDGDGFAPEILPHLGDPYLAGSGLRPVGMGLGIFIAMSLLERVGATVRFANRSGPAGAGGSEIIGARIDISWPRAYFAAPVEQARQGMEEWKR
jgi:two-component system, sensor histidine kinase RegB